MSFTPVLLEVMEHADNLEKHFRAPLVIRPNHGTANGVEDLVWPSCKNYGQCICMYPESSAEALVFSAPWNEVVGSRPVFGNASANATFDERVARDSNTDLEQYSESLKKRRARRREFLCISLRIILEGILRKNAPIFIFSFPSVKSFCD